VKLSICLNPILEFLPRDGSAYQARAPGLRRIFYPARNLATFATNSNPHLSSQTRSPEHLGRRFQA
ncbi:MAG: hypothetical protein OEQ18_02680, partial [Gammaproteobacteria bacterium]|nr:hypothetical protein [Gammaproteobacteria bacterium]